MRLVITVSTPAETTDVLIDAEPETPLPEIIASVCRTMGLTPAASGAGPSLAQSGLLDGAVLRLGVPSAHRPERQGRAEVRFVGGPQAGRIEQLGVGETIWGIGEDGGAVSDAGDPTLSMLMDLDGRVTLRLLTRDDESHSAVRVEQEVVGDDIPWHPHEQLHLGASVLTLHPVTRGDIALLASDGGWLDYNRPPRLLPPTPVNSFRQPAPPAAPQRTPMPWITALLPAVLGVAMAVLMRQPFYLLFALMTPVMMIGANISSRRNGKKTHRRLLAEHAATLASIAEEVEMAVLSEQRARRALTPDAAELRAASTVPTRRLWERRSSDPDHLLVRVGTADLPSAVRLEDAAELEHRRASTATNHAVPVTLSLDGVTGVAGEAGWARDVGRWMIGQLAVAQSPRDLQICVLGAAEDASHWQWARWLPHVRPSLGQDALVLTGFDTESVGRRVSELTQLVAERLTARAAAGGSAARFTPDVLVVLDGARRLRALPGIVSLLREGPAVGVHVLCLDADERQLPEECTAVVLERDDGLAVRVHNAIDTLEVCPDTVAADWFETVARALSPLRDVSPSDSDSVLPTTANLLEILGLSSPTPDRIATRWARGGRSTEAVIGISLDGPFSIDLVRDGPHGLVAGTTGAGKSEFLQTLVASLAVANRPDEMTFVLVDYKGGAAFSECALLPHTVGMVTDLDAHLVRRALGSLRAELIRREEILGEVGAKDLDAYYTHLSRSGGEGLPRLLIVIDEFAAMAKELPDFVSGLIGIAQRGRSLGVHLVMATQRPSGVISPEIRANTNLRVALRMTDAAESSDVIDVADAARIDKAIPGRALVRLGHASLIPFQTARIGGPVVRTGDVSRRAPFVTRLDADRFSRPAPRPPAAGSVATTVTELSVLVTAVRGASDHLAIPAQHSPWLPPLRDAVRLDTLGAARGAELAWAREDLPDRQFQRDAVIDLDAFGHLFVVGAPGSGRSQALRTIAASAAQRFSTADLHVYGIDCGNGALSGLSALPHCGAVALRNQSERATRLIQRLQAEVTRRHEVLGLSNHANIAEQRAHSAPADRLPRVLVLIDRWENFLTTLAEIDGGILLDAVHALLRDGASAGVHLVIAGDRSLLSSRMSVFTDDKVVLRLTDRTDYSLADINYKNLPADIPPGRGFRSGTGVELQVALLGDDASGKAQTAALVELGSRMNERDAAVPAAARPFRVDDLPSELTLDDALERAVGASTGPLWALLGVGGDALGAVGMDLERDAPTFIVAGPARSGRSTLIAAMADSLLRSGAELVLVCPRTSPLREYADVPGVRAVLTHIEITEDDLVPHLDPQRDPARETGGTPVVLIVDDGELIREAPAKTWLRDYIRTAGDNRRGLVLAGNSAELGAGFSGWQVDARKNRRGALLSPQNTIDGDLVGARVSRSMASSRVSPGRAFVHLGTGEFVTVQVPARTSAPSLPHSIPPIRQEPSHAEHLHV